MEDKTLRWWSTAILIKICILDAQVQVDPDKYQSHFAKVNMKKALYAQLLHPTTTFLGSIFTQNFKGYIGWDAEKVSNYDFEKEN